ncbi:MAG TPA: acyltransferase family protein [Nitrososphaera sp.]|nr:acyltransferase family protein [Nitrososphaera sp.]
MQSVVKSKARFFSIDLTRGLAMCLIILFHSVGLLAIPFSSSASFVVLKIGNLGIPMFTIISGLMLGYFLHAHDRRSVTNRRYVRRGVLLLMGIHFLNAVGVYPFYMEGSTFLHSLIFRWFITDTLGLIFLLTPLMGRLDAKYRLLLGVVMLVAWKPLDMVITTESNAMLLFREIVFGVHEDEVQILDYLLPFFPIMGIFLVGTFIGDRFAASLEEGRVKRFIWSMVWVAVSMMCLFLFLTGVWFALRTDLVGLRNQFLQNLLYQDRFYSLLPFYLSACIGVFGAIAYTVEVKKLNGRALEWIAIFGRTTLSTYVAQYYVVQGIPSLLGWKHNLTLTQWAGAVIIMFLILQLLARGVEFIYRK